jgi:hypothetical protein
MTGGTGDVGPLKSGAEGGIAELSFRQTISAAGPNDPGFKVIVDRKAAKVLISI